MNEMMSFKQELPINYHTELLNNFKKEKELTYGEKMKFSGVDGYDVYNISAPFNTSDKRYIAGRIEKTEAIANSQIMFFEEIDGVWCLNIDEPAFKLEDGFVSKINNEIIFGGVEVYPSPKKENPDNIDYRTVFYRGKDISSLKRFTNGPEKMKDIRLISLPNGKIGVFTRPQGEIGGRGKIGYIELENLDELTPENILKAKIIENQFGIEEWGGANELHLLPNNKIGVIGHIAYEDENGKHYHVISFSYDPKTNIASPIKIIATRENFPDGKSKSPELKDVLFPGGLIKHNDGTATLYVGLSDTEAGNKIITDPFETQ